MTLARAGACSAGFSIIEVMISLFVISIGLLGVAKMQALALSSTGVARLRSLAAIEGASLASAMHANRAYWTQATLTQPIAVTSAAATTSDANLTAALAVVRNAMRSGSEDYCSTGHGAPCAPVTIAAADLQEWASDLNRMLPNSSALITCPTTSIPLSCTIQITWSENSVAVNKQAADATDTGAFRIPTYRLVVEP